MTIDITFDSNGRRKRVASEPDSDMCFNVTIIGDLFVENSETFDFILSSTDGDIVLSPNMATVFIINDDCKFEERDRKYTAEILLLRDVNSL